MNFLRRYWADLVALLFPELCHACGNSLIAHEELICTDCIYNLPYTDFQHRQDNIVTKQFWGKIKLDNAYALCYFTKGGKVQALVHELKYRNAPLVGSKLGLLAGQRMAESERLNKFDAVIPVPLHNGRLRKRGYNQSAHFAEGIAQAIGSTVSIDNLIRTKATQTQTHKTRFERAANMKDVFAVKDANALTNKHVLLVDDVVTTGATLESCAHVLLAIPGLRLSIATIAYAE